MAMPSYYDLSNPASAAAAQAATARSNAAMDAGYRQQGYGVTRNGATVTLTGGNFPAYNIGSPNFNTYLKDQNLPDWSQTQAGFNKLQQQAPGMFDSSGYASAALGLGQNLLSQGISAANAASRQYMSTASRNGVSGGYGAGIARAQALIPAQQEANRLRLGAEEFKAQQSASLAGYLGNLNQQLSSAQQAYQNNLAGYNQGVLGIQNNNAQWRSSQALERERYEEAKRQQRLAQQNTQGQRPASSGGGFKGNFFQGYIPNSGPIRPATLNGQALYGDTVMYSSPQIANWSMAAR